MKELSERARKVLEARVRGVNAAHAYALQLCPVLRERFAPLVGQKVLKNDGTLMAKYTNLLPEFPYSHRLHVYKHTSEYSLAWTVKTCEVDVVEGTGHAYYYETTVYVGDLSNGVLTKITPHPYTGRTDHTVEGVVAVREEFEAARKVFDDARSALHPFGEYDR